MCKLVGCMACTQCKHVACCYRCSVVCMSVSVCMLDTTVSPTKTAELWTQTGPRNHVLGGGAEPAKGRGNFGGRSSHWNAVHYSVSSKCRSSTGLQTCLQGTAHHGESVASEWTHLPRGWQVQGRCGLSSKFFDHLSLLLLQLTDLRRTEPLKAINRLIQQTARVNCEMQKPQQAKCLTLQKNWANSHSYDKHHWTTPHYSTALRHNTDYSLLPARHYASTVYEQWPSVCVSLTQVKSCIEMSGWIELVFGKGFPSIYSTVLQGNSSVYKNKGTSLWNFHSFMHIHTSKNWHTVQQLSTENKDTVIMIKIQIQKSINVINSPWYVDHRNVLSALQRGTLRAW